MSSVEVDPNALATSSPRLDRIETLGPLLPRSMASTKLGSSAVLMPIKTFLGAVHGRLGHELPLSLRLVELASAKPPKARIMHAGRMEPGQTVSYSLRNTPRTSFRGMDNPVVADRTAMLEQAMIHHRAGRLEEAESLYRQLLASDRGHALANYGVAVIHYSAGRKQEAAAHFAEALESDAAFADAYLDLTTVLKELKQFDMAVKVLERGTQYCPGNSEITAALVQLRGSRLHDQAIELASQGRTTEAVQALEQSIALVPRNIKAHENLGASTPPARAIERRGRFVAGRWRLIRAGPTPISTSVPCCWTSSNSAKPNAIFVSCSLPIRTIPR